MAGTVRPGIGISAAAISISPPAVPIGPELTVTVPGSISPVTSVIIIPVIPYSLKRVSVQSIGYISVINT
jgi:hypothetical protein